MLSIVASFIFWGFWIVFFTITWNSVLVKEVSGWFSSCYNCWGDWSAHLSYTTSFAYDQSLPWQLPIMAGHKFSYPFLVDLVSGILVKLGLNLRWALIIPGWILSILLIWLIVKLGEELTGEKSIGKLASFLFLFNGGGAYLNIVVSRLVPQRGWLAGMVMALLVYLLLWRKKPVWAGLMAGLLPLVQIHSYLAVLVVGFWSGWRFLFPALALGLPQILYFFPDGANLIRIQPVWLTDSWPVLVLGTIGFLLAKQKLRKFVWPFWGLFLLGHLLIFQPWGWDNTKIFDHWYLIMCLLGGVTLVKIWEGNRQKKIVVATLLIASTYSGLTQTIKFNQYQKNKYQFFSNEQLSLAEMAKRIIPSQAVVLTASNHNHWLPALTGRKIVLGYAGWLWSYGIDYTQREKDVRLMYGGSTSAVSLLKTYQVNYVLIGPEEKKQFSVNEAWFKENFTEIELNQENALYRIS